MAGKKEKFFEILQKYGVTEYWCTPGFNPDEDNPCADLFFPFCNASLVMALDDLYNDYETDGKDLFYAEAEEDGTDYFEHLKKNKERRVINY